ncbi:SLAIN motif-containing protein-like [Antennarius striatus]|uniref:SLAIN motif-containing protein-like n=1 Tax=Antennarius striatus TaxID=241820 RepID=UPI0035B48A32
MELQDQLKSDRSQYLYSHPLLDFDPSSNCPNFCSRLKTSSVKLGCSSEAHWRDDIQAEVKNYSNHSFARDARIRLDNLKSGCSSNLPCCGMNGMLYDHKELWDSEESDEEESALDMVELLDVEVDVQDEENWLYESPKKPTFGERNESALGWCRHILDNPSPDMEAACRSLINKLDQRLNSCYYRHSANHHGADVSVHSSIDETFATTRKTSERTDSNKWNILHKTSTNPRLQDITDVQIMAHMQEASLRRDCVFTPAAVSPWRDPEPAMMFPYHFNTHVENIYNFDTKGETDAPFSSCLQPCLSSPGSSSSPSVSKQGCQSPRLSRLHQQVTQFKLLKLTQIQGAPPSRTKSPLRTSLRSLQAVRNSRSLDIDNYQPTESQITPPQSSASPVRKGSNIWSPSHVTSVRSSDFMKSGRGSMDRTTAVKRLQRSQSVSPCRIQHTAKGCLPAPGRVFASPERSTAVAWVRNAPPTRR